VNLLLLCLNTSIFELQLHRPWLLNQFYFSISNIKWPTSVMSGLTAFFCFPTFAVFLCGGLPRMRETPKGQKGIWLRQYFSKRLP